MSATDKAMAAWLEQAWLQRYLERELSAEETEWFEVYAMDKPALLERIEQDLDLRDGVAASIGAEASHTPVAMHQAANSPPQAPVDVPHHPPSAALAQSPFGNWLSRAAMVLASVSLGWFAASQFQAGAPVVNHLADDLIADPPRIVFDIQRGEVDPPLLFHIESSSPLLLVEVGMPMDAKDIQLLRGDRAAQALRVNSEGFASFLLPRHPEGQAETMELTYSGVSGTVRRTLDIPATLQGGLQ